jgi:hypothetical protein
MARLILVKSFLAFGHAQDRQPLTVVFRLKTQNAFVFFEESVCAHACSGVVPQGCFSTLGASGGDAGLKALED